jgi:multicomponent Na+:H+ antiporter subunit B
MKGMTFLNKTTARFILPLVLIFGLYLMLHGDVSHGAGFAGGVFIFLGLMLIVLAYGRHETVKRLSEPAAILTGGVALIVLVLLAAAGMLKTGFFSPAIIQGAPGQPFNAVFIVMVNVLICIAAAASLFLLFMSLLSFKQKSKG